MSYEYERITQPASGLRLHLNENTAGCSPRVLAALHGITREQAACYPDYDEVTRACADRFGVSPDQILLTNGLDEAILGISIAALRRRSNAIPEAIVIVPTFDMYPACADSAGGRVVEVSTGSNFEFPCDAVLGALTSDTRLIFITTPNNPTGRSVPFSQTLQIARAAPDAIVFVDEAYADFSGETLIGHPELSSHPNVLIGRTFSKAYGLAGLRIGALIGASAALGANPAHSAAVQPQRLRGRRARCGAGRCRVLRVVCRAGAGLEGRTVFRAESAQRALLAERCELRSGGLRAGCPAGDCRPGRASGPRP